MGAIQQFANGPVRVGSDPSCEITFPGASAAGVMPKHAELRLEHGRLVVVDLGTPHGTHVAGLRVMHQVLRNGEAVRFGGPDGPELRVELVADGPAPVAAQLVHGAAPHAPAPPAPDPPPLSPAELARLGVPAAAFGPDGKVDVATAQRIVRDAVARATSSPDRTAEIVAQRVSDATRKTARGHGWLKAGVALALLASVAAAVLLWRSRRAADALADEVGLDKKPVAAPQGSIPKRILNGREIFEANRGAIYLMGYVSGNTVGGCCTAFAIGPDLLATNAHCVYACGNKAGAPVVTLNDSGGKQRLTVKAMAAHPGYKRESTSADSPDVGLLRIQGTMPTYVRLASDAELRSIGPGDDAFVIGFPGRVMDPLSPSATFLSGRVGRVMGFAEEATTTDKAFLVQHDAVTRGGNSGSPIFNQYGNVIAIHAAHLDEETEVDVGGQKTKVLGSSPYRVGMRIDLLRGVPAP